MKFPTIRPIEIEDNDGAMQKLRKELFNDILTEFTLHFRNLAAGRSGYDVLLDAAKRLRDAGLEVLSADKEKAKLLNELKELANDLETSVKERLAKVNPDQARIDERRVRQFQLELKLQLLKLKDPEHK